MTLRVHASPVRFARAQSSLARQTARCDSSLARQTARCDSSLARQTARCDHSALRRSAALSLAVGLALVGCDTQRGAGLPALEGPGAAAAPAIVAPEPAPAEEQAAVLDRASTGTLRAREVAALGPKEPGVITALNVNEGDRVRRGQVLFRLDSVQVALAVEQANATLASSKVQLDSAQTLFDRVKALRERGAATPDAYDQAKAQVDSARSMVVQAQAAVDSATHRLSNMVVTSPLDGVVTEKRMNVGENATLMPPSVVLVIQNVDVLELHARLPEMALSSVHEGGTITVRFPAIGVSRDVTVKRIAPTVDPRTRTIEVIAELPNSDHRLLAGMLVEVSYEQAAPAEPAAAPAQVAPAKGMAAPEPTAPTKRAPQPKRPAATEPLERDR